MTDEEYNKIAAVVLMRLAQSIAAAMGHEVKPVSDACGISSSASGEDAREASPSPSV